MGLLATQPKKAGLLAGNTLTNPIPSPFFSSDTSVSGSTPMVPNGQPDIAGAFVKGAIQAPFKATGGLLATGKQLITGQPSTFQPQGIQTPFFGSEPIQSIPTQYEQGKTALEGSGVPSVIAPVIAGIAAGGEPLLDLSLFGGGKTNALKAIADVKDFAEAASIGRQIGVSEDLIKQFADQAIQAKNAKEAQAVVDSISNLQKTTRVAPTLQSGGLLAESLPTETSNIVPQTGQILKEALPTSEALAPRPALPVSLTESIPQFNPESYVADQVAKQEAARTASNPTVLERVGSFLQNTKARIVDFTSPIEDVLHSAVSKNDIKLLPSEDIHNQIDRVLRSPTLAGQFAKDNGLIDVIKNTDNLDNLDQYLIAKHSIELDTQGITTGRNLAQDQALVKALAPRYEAAALKIKAYSDSLLDYAVKTGLVNKDLAIALRKKYPDYVPFNRIFSEEEQASQYGTKAVASLSKQTAVQAIKGSEREVESPIKSFLGKTYEIFQQGEKNIAGRILAGYEKLPGNPFQLRELAKGETAKNTISFFDKGVKRTFSTTAEIAQAAKSLNVQQLNILEKTVRFFTRIARLGITGINLPFITANIAKDQVTAFINSNNALRTSIANPRNFLNALFQAVGHGKLYEEMVRAGGAGTSFDIAREQAVRTVETIRSNRTVASKAKYIIYHPVRSSGDLLRTVENVVARSEELTRIQMYRGTKEALLKQGMSESEAIIGAAREARDATVNFARRGEFGSVLNSVFLYLNASIQGTRTLLRNLKTKPLQTSIKIATSVFFPIATVTAWNLSDPKRKAAYDDIPDFEKQNNMIVIPPNPVKDDKGMWNVIKVPLSQEINNLANLPRKMLEALHGENPVGFKDFADALIGTVSPVNPTPGSVLSTFTPQIIKPTLEEAVNKNLFTGFPVVSDSLSKLSPQNQVKADTSGVARKIGELLNLSPIKVQDWIKETFGGIAPQALNAVDHVLAATGQIPQDQIGGQNILDAITARFNKARGGQLDQQAIDEIKVQLQEQADKANQLTHQAEQVVASIQGLPKEQAIAKLDAITKDNKPLADKIVSTLQAQKLGLTVTDRFINQLDVLNGERAKYIVAHVNQLATREEKAAYLNDLQKKKIISPIVQEQIIALLKAKK